MENKEEKMEQLIRSLREAKPVLNNPGSLTDSIMQEIKEKPAQKVSPLLILTRAVLSSAAVLLFGLFIFQQTDAQENRTSTLSRPVIELKIDADSTCIQILNNDQSNLMETYLCYMQQNAIENEFSKPYPKPKTLQL